MRGKVSTGIGVEKAWDWERASNRLGFTPYPGSLNILPTKPLPEPDKDRVVKLSFGRHKRVCAPGTINGIGCYICAKEKKGFYKSTVYFVVAPICLREELNLKDHNIVKLELI